MSNSEFGKRLHDWQDKARKKAEEVNLKYDIKGKVDESLKAAGEVSKKVADVVSTGITAAKEQAEKIDSEHEVTGKVKQATTTAQDSFRQAATQAQETIKNQTGNLREGVKTAGAQAEEFFGNAKQYYEYASSAAETGAKTAKVTASLSKVVTNAKNWIKENPGKSAVVTFSMIAGTRIGAIFPNLDVSIIGAGGAGNWFFHSATAQYGLRKLTEKYADYLKAQEQLINEGKLDEAERSRVEFQKNALKYVGAPLLGTFSIAAGATLMYEAFTGGLVTGFPVSLILGGNPLLNSIWLFGNGLVCFHNGYKFFMIALADEEEVVKIVREVRGMLPEAVAI